MIASSGDAQHRSKGLTVYLVLAKFKSFSVLSESKTNQGFVCNEMKFCVPPHKVLSSSVMVLESEAFGR